jgi:glycosyltransferase involved in cell wall biosynthesis
MESNTNKKLLNIMVVEPRGSGGMIHYAYQLCNALANVGAQVTLVTAHEYEMESFPHNFRVRKQMKLWSLTESPETGTSNGWLQKATQKLYRGMRRVTRGVRLIVEWTRLTNYLIKAKPDIIQFGSIEFPFEAFFLNILKHNGIILSQICHEFESRERGNNLIISVSNQLYRWVYESFLIVFFHGENNKQRFLSLFDLPKERLHIIPHGNEQLFLSVRSKTLTSTQMRERYGIDTDAPVILFFGNLTPSKGLPDLLKAFSQVYAQEPSARLIIVGRPTKFIDMDQITKLADELGIIKATIIDAHYLPMENVAPLMDMATLVIYPYLSSTQSGALQVAYTFGKPVIATNVGGLPEAVDDGKSGFLVPPSSSDDLSRAILKLIRDPNLVKDMGNYSKHLSDTKFSWDSIAQEIRVIYEDAVNSRDC